MKECNVLGDGNADRIVVTISVGSLSKGDRDMIAMTLKLYRRFSYGGNNVQSCFWKQIS